MKKFYNLLAVLFVMIGAALKAQPVLGTTNFAVNGTISWNTNSPCVATKTADVQGWLVSVNSTSNCGINQSNSGGGDGRLQYLVGFGTLTQASFGTDDGSEFALVNLTWGASTSSFTSKSINFIGYKNGMPVPGATLNAVTGPLSGPTNTSMVSFAGNPNFANVDNVLIVPTQTCSSILFFDDITIASPTICTVSPTLTVTGSNNVSCNGGSNGSATVSASGSGPFTYTWSPGGGSAAAANALSAGVYTVGVTNSCNLSTSRTVNISQPSAIVTSTAVTSALCFGGVGSASVTASGGTGALTYSWSTSSIATTITGSAGAYTVNVKDANLCSVTRIANITQPTAISSSTGVTNVACNGGLGSATITASGGTGPRSFLWSTSATNSFITAPAGVYTATITDANNCSVTRTVSIAQPAALNTTISVANVLCNGSTGSATVTAAGGSGAFTYLWSSGNATTAVLSNVLTGVYTATVTDANACTSIKSATITQPASLATTTAITNVLCNGGTGSATVTASGGTGTYNYLWSTNATTSVITSISGVRTVTVTDANACVKINTVNITEPAAITATTAVTNVLCNGGTGSSTVTAGGGTGVFTYSWSTTALTASVTNIIAGQYTVTIKDANNCSVAKTVTVTQPPVLTSTVSVTNTPCFGGISSATVSASGGTGPYSTVWPNLSVTNIYTTNTSGILTATLSDSNLCTSVKTVTLVVPGLLTLSVSPSASTLCAGSSLTLSLIASGGTAPMTYSWSSGPASNMFVHSPTVSGVYTGFVYDANLCTNSATIGITVIATPTITATNGSICPGADFTITPSGASNYTFVTSSSTFTGTTLSVSPLVNTTYTISGISPNGCVSRSIHDATTTVSTLVSPQLSITATPTAICSGATSSLMVTGANTYTWLNTSSNATMISVSPGSTTVYTVTGTGTNVCNGVQVTTITVNITPTVSVSSGEICSGESFTIIPSGADTYSFSGGSPVVSPLVSTDYSVTGTSLQGCASANSAVSNLTVNSVPVISVNSGSICVGSSFTMTPSGAATYTFSNGMSIVSPLSNSSYSVIGTSAEGCAGSNTAVAQVTVNALPTITVNSGTICAGETFTMNPTGGNTYTFSSGSSTVQPLVTSMYSVSGSDTFGCVNFISSTVNVNSLPVVNVTGTTAIICTGEDLVFNASGALLYQWDNSMSTSSIIVTPTVTTIYTVTGTDANGCSGYNTFTQNVAECTGLSFVKSSDVLLNIYPNPSNGTFNINSAADIELSIINELGQLVKTLTLNEKNNRTISLSEMPNGVYFIIGNNGSNSVKQKVIVSR